MRGVEFKDQDFVIGKPIDMTDDECQGLPVKMAKNGKYDSLESVWELSDAEIEQVIKSKRIRVGILGHGMPPIYLQVENEGN